MTAPVHSAPRRVVTVLAAGVLGALLLGACGSSSPRAARASATAPSSPTGAPGSATVWLCRPGATDDPCATPFTATAVNADGSRSVVSRPPAASPGVDCFYVYPTVSTEPGRNADLTVQPAEVAAAVAQASPFSTVCRVWAPMYRQETASDLIGPGGTIRDDPAAQDVAYESLLSAWRDYLAHDNGGRPVVFIGHSQGAAMLIRLLASQVDPDPALRARLVLAIIAGGNVQVPVAADVGGSFEHIPACRAPGQAGCVVAYSSFDTPPPPDSLFGRPGQGVSLQSGRTTVGDQQVLCTNPAALGGGAGALEAAFPSRDAVVLGRRITTPWVSFPGLYRGQCESIGGATWLQVDATPGDPRPVVTEAQGPRWGLHADDVNLAVGNLVADVASAAAAHGS